MSAAVTAERILVTIGILLLVAAVFADVGDLARVAFAGVALVAVALGVLLPRLEGPIKVGPQGLESTMRERKQAVNKQALIGAYEELISPADEQAHERLLAMQGLLDHVVPGPDPTDPDDPNFRVIDVAAIQRERERLLRLVESFKRLGYDTETAFSLAVRGVKPPTS